VDDVHRISVAELTARLGCTARGLSRDEAADRLTRDGPNTLTTEKPTPAILQLLRELRNPFAILLLAGAALAGLAEALSPQEGSLQIAVALLVVVALNTLFTWLQRRRSERIMDRFARMLPKRIVVLRGGVALAVEAESVVVGDVVRLEAGDRVPADGRLIEVRALSVDNSSLTGESEPQARTLECTHDDALYSRNLVFSGTSVLAGSGLALVVAIGMNTRLGQIAALTGATRTVPSPMRLELGRFIRVITAIAIGLGVVFFFVSLAGQRGALPSLIFAIGIIVANVPEGLLPTVTLALAMACRRMSDRNALVKHLESVETLGSTTVICSDKTGTLTQNRIALNSLVLGLRELAAYDHTLAHQRDVQAAREVMVLCNNARLTDGTVSGDPTEAALLAWAAELGPIEPLRTASPRADELPFDSRTRRMITVHDTAAGARHALLKGAPEVVLAQCTSVLREGRPTPMSKRDRSRATEICHRLAGRGERVLALARRPISDPADLKSGFALAAIVGLEDPPRPEVASALERCRTAGIRVLVLTGDHPVTARAVAIRIGLMGASDSVVTGDTLAKLTDAEATTLVGRDRLVLARIAPEQKLRVVRLLQAAGEVVTVTGDGVNDAPALKHADMGVAMGVVGTDIARDAADMVLMDDNFATIVAAVEEGRAVFDNVRKFVAYILTSNVPEILPFIAWAVVEIPLPLTIPLILCIDLGTDIVPALALGREPPEDDVMERPPRADADRLLTESLLRVSYGLVGVIQAAAGFFAFFFVLVEGGWEGGAEAPDQLHRRAVSAFFAAVVVCQVADVMICRSRRSSLWTVGPLRNWLVLAGIAAELTLVAVILYVPVANRWLGTEPLTLLHLSLGVPFAVFIVFADEVRKVLIRRGSPFVLRWLSW